MPGQRRWPGHVCERQGQHGALRSVGESGGAERLRPQLLQLPLELHPAVLKPGLDLGEGEKTRLVTTPPRFDYPVVGSRAVAIPRARAAAAAPLTCTSERRILPASCRRSAAPRYCCRWKELSRVLICSALNAVRSRRPPRPHGSSGPAHSGPSSGTAPDGLPPAPGHRDKEEERRVSQARAPRGEPPPPPPRAATAQWRLPGKAGSAPDPPAPPGSPGCPAVPAAGAAAPLSRLRPPVPSPSRGPAGRSGLRSLWPRLEPEPGPWPADDARCGEPSVGLLRVWLLWDNHSTEKGALVIVPRFGDAGKEARSTGLSFIAQLPEESVVCVNTHQRAR